MEKQNESSAANSPIQNIVSMAEKRNNPRNSVRHAFAMDHYVRSNTDDFQWISRPPRGTHLPVSAVHRNAKQKRKSKRMSSAMPRLPNTFHQKDRFHSTNPSILLPALADHNSSPRHRQSRMDTWLSTDASINGLPIEGPSRKMKKTMPMQKETDTRLQQMSMQKSKNNIREEEAFKQDKSLCWAQSLPRRKRTVHRSDLSRLSKPRATIGELHSENIESCEDQIPAMDVFQRTEYDGREQTLHEFSDEVHRERTILRAKRNTHATVATSYSQREKEQKTTATSRRAAQIARDYMRNSLEKSQMLVDCARAVLKDCIRERTHSSERTSDKLSPCPEKECITDRRFVNSHRSDEEVSDIAKVPSHSFRSIRNEEYTNNGKSSHSEANMDDEQDSELPWRNPSHSSDEEATAFAKMSCSSSDSSEPRLCMSIGIDGLSDKDEDEIRGLPVQLRYQLPISLTTAKNTDTACSICQTTYGIGEHMMKLPCNHFFHAICADRWLYDHKSCPICRAEISAEMILSEITSTKSVVNNLSEKEQNDARRRLRTISNVKGFKVINADNGCQKNIPGRKFDYMNKLICPVAIRRHT